MRNNKNNFRIAMRRFALFACFAALICVESCGNLFFPPLEIESVSIKEGYVNVADIEHIEVVFSKEPEIRSIEQAFSLTENGALVQGSFVFNGRNMKFRPLMKLNENKDFVLKITTDAEDTSGISLENDFVLYFTSKKKHDSPEVVSISPENQSVTENEPEAIEIVFSKAIDKDSFVNALSITPGFDYLLDWTDDWTKARIIPQKNLVKSQRYTVTINTNLADLHGNNLENSFTSTFLYGSDLTAPDFKIYINEKNTSYELSTCSINDNITTQPKITIEFDKKVSLNTISGFVSVSPEVQFKISPDNESGRRVEMSWTNKLQWNTAYRITIREGIKDLFGNKCGQKEFVILTNNEASRPVQFEKAYFDLDESKTELKERYFTMDSTNSYSTMIFPALSYELGVAVSTYMYIIVGISREASAISLPSAMQAFRISAGNSCASFSIKNIEAAGINDALFNDIRALLTADNLAGRADIKIYGIKFKIEVTMKDAPGLINFSVSSVLSDDLGNTMEDWLGVYNKG